MLNVRFSLTTEVKHLTTNTWHHYSKRLQLKWWQTGVLWPLSRLWAFPVFWIKITSEGNKKSAEHRSFYRYIPLWYDKNLLLTFKLELNYYLTDYLFTKNDSFFPTKFQSLVVLWFFFFSLNGVSLLLLQVFRRFNEYYFLRLFSHVVGYNNRATNQQIVLLISYS